MSSSPYISVIIPLYGATTFLEECVDSVIQQTYTNWELVIAIYGHGEDGGEAKIKADEIASKDKRIRVIIHSSNFITKVQLYNELVDTVNGEWISFLNVKDTWHPEKLAKQMEMKQTVAKNAAVIGTFVKHFGDSDIIPVLKSEWVSHNEMLQYNNIVPSSAIFHRSYNHWRFVEGSCGSEEYDMWIRILLSGGKLYNIPEHLTNIRINNKRDQPNFLSADILVIHYKNALKNILAVK